MAVSATPALEALAQQADAIDKDALGAHFGRRLQQQAVGRTQFLLEHLRAGKDDLQLLLRLQFLQGPSPTWPRRE